MSSSLAVRRLSLPTMVAISGKAFFNIIQFYRNFLFGTQIYADYQDFNTKLRVTCYELRVKILFKIQLTAENAEVLRVITTTVYFYLCLSVKICVLI